MTTTRHDILITDPGVLAISVVDNNEPLIDLRDTNDILFGPPPECNLTTNDYTKIRLAVYQKLLRAQAELSNGFRLRLYEGYRSIKVQQLLFDDIYSKTGKRLPNATDEQRFYEATRLVSPVINLDGSKTIPPHNTGGAIDIEIVDQHGELIDMGMTAADWRDVHPNLCGTDYANLPDNVKQNRQLLFDVMTQQGFVNYPTEWWHYSYGERYWAYHSGAELAFYGPVESV